MKRRSLDLKGEGNISIYHMSKSNDSYLITTAAIFQILHCPISLNERSLLKCKPATHSNGQHMLSVTHEVLQAFTYFPNKHSSCSQTEPPVN